MIYWLYLWTNAIFMLTNILATIQIHLMPIHFSGNLSRWKNFMFFFHLTMNMGLTKKIMSTPTDRHTPFIICHSIPPSCPEHSMQWSWGFYTSMIIPCDLHKSILLIKQAVQNSDAPNFFSNNFSKMYIYKKNVVNPSSILTAGWANSRSLVNARYRMKLYKLYERATDYMYNFWVYEAKISQV